MSILSASSQRTALDSALMSNYKDRSMPTPPSPRMTRYGTFFDKAFGLIAFLCVCVTLTVLFGILLSLVVGAWPAITHFGIGFLVQLIFLIKNH